jgi:hypothetical protein
MLGQLLHLTVAVAARSFSSSTEPDSGGGRHFHQFWAAAAADVGAKTCNILRNPFVLHLYYCRKEI